MNGARGGWELTKENIQPLSSGRRMAYLAESLPVCTASGFNDQHQYEEHHLQKIKKLEEAAERGDGDDPLQLWVDAIKYIEQHFPSMSPNIMIEYGSLIKKAVRFFHYHDRYKNDKRFVSVLIKSVENFPLERQVNMLKLYLERGMGSEVSDIYKFLAEIYDREGDTKKASEILKQGIQKKAQPIAALEEMLTCIQLRWAERFAKQLQSRQDGDEASEGARTFASSVPVVGDKNEAISIRQNLPLAAPTNASRSKPANKVPKTVPIFKNENSPENMENKPNVSGMREIHFDQPGDDRENRLEASRWNTENDQLFTPLVPERPPKLQLFEGDVSQCPAPSVVSSKSVPDRRVLKERKEEQEEAEEVVKVSVPNVSVPAPASSEKKGTDNNSAQVKIEIAYDPEKEVKKLHKKIKFTKERLASHRRCLPVESDFFDKIKYKPLCPDRSVSRSMITEARFWEKREAELNPLRVLEKARRELHLAKEEYQLLQEGYELLKTKMVDEEKLKEVMLQEKNGKIKELEAQVEDLMTNLTKLTTENNVLNSKMDRERGLMQLQFRDLETKVSALQSENQRLEDELQRYRAQEELLRRNNSAVRNEMHKRDNGPFAIESSEFFEHVPDISNLRPSAIDVSSSCRSNSGSSEHASEGSAETSKFASGETTVAGNSFMPNVSMDISRNASQNQTQPQRKALGLVECHLVGDSMNTTPATGVVDFESEPAPSFGLNMFKRPSRPFSLYESISDSFSQPKPNQAQNRPKAGVVKNLQMLPENRPPTSISSNENDIPRPRETLYLHESPPAVARNRGNGADTENQGVRRGLQPSKSLPSFPSDENAISAPRMDPPPSFSFDPTNRADDDENRKFVKPALPTRKAVPSFASNDASASGGTYSGSDCFMNNPNSDLRRRLSILSKRSLTDNLSDDEEEEVIVRRHQQTGVDLNISNLTTVLMLGPKPLVNSTPEREKTLREIQAVPFDRDQPEVEETQDLQGNDRFSRYNSILNDPPLNLSTIQETSRENRSRSTTSSSSGGMTMSSTRFGMAASSNHGHVSNNNTRSSSIPRSGSRTSHNNNNTGYYSDTNGK